MEWAKATFQFIDIRNLAGSFSKTLFFRCPASPEAGPLTILQMLLLEKQHSWKPDHSLAQTDYFFIFAQFPAMRKTAAHLLLTCFGMYHLGFFAVQFLMPIAIHHHWESQLWENEDSILEGRLVRVPFSLPYGQNQENFQPANFSMEIDGKTSRVIKQRYFDEHLEVIVVDDQLQMNLDEQVGLWISSVSSNQGDFEGPPLQKVLLRSFVKDFVSNSHFTAFSGNVSENTIDHSSSFLLSIPQGTRNIFLPPPRQFSFA